MHPYYSLIERQHFTAKLFEPHIFENKTQRRKLSKTADAFTSHVGTNYIKCPIASAILRIDVIQIHQSDIFPIAHDNPIFASRISHCKGEPCAMLLRANLVIGIHVFANIWIIPPPSDHLLILNSKFSKQIHHPSLLVLEDIMAATRLAPFSSTTPRACLDSAALCEGRPIKASMCSAKLAV